MNVVVDVSSAAELVLGRSRGPVLREILADADALVVPELYSAEATNLFWKLHVLGGLERGRCERALRNALELPDRYVPCADLYEEVYALACERKRSAYDLFYVVLARRRAALLLTEDRALARLACEVGVRLG